jgi:hypothetical protein
VIKGEGIIHMAMITIVCPKCGGVAKLSLVDTNYFGPRRCWKCHEYFTIAIENNRITSCEPLSQEEFERQQEEKKAAEKARSGISFSRQEEPGIRQLTLESRMEDSKTPEKTQSGINFSKHEEPEIRQLTLESQMEETKSPKKTQSGISFSGQEKTEIRQVTPESKQEFIRPLLPEQPSVPADSGRPAGTFPPDRVRTFIPVHDMNKEPEKPKKPKKPSSQMDAGEPPTTFPPDKFQTFVPLENLDKEP